jgi:hypothetical protein
VIWEAGRFTSATGFKLRGRDAVHLNRPCSRGLRRLDRFVRFPCQTIHKVASTASSFRKVFMVATSSVQRTVLKTKGTPLEVFRLKISQEMPWLLLRFLAYDPCHAPI